MCAAQFIRTHMAWIHAAHVEEVWGMFKSQNNVVFPKSHTGHQRGTIELIILCLFILRNKWQVEELDSKINALAPYCMDEDSVSCLGKQGDLMDFQLTFIFYSLANIPKSPHAKTWKNNSVYLFNYRVAYGLAELTAFLLRYTKHYWLWDTDFAPSYLVFNGQDVLLHLCVCFSVRITQKYPRLMTAGPGQQAEQPLIDTVPSELGSLAIATPTSLLPVYSAHISLLPFRPARSASICQFGKLVKKILIRVVSWLCNKSAR